MTLLWRFWMMMDNQMQLRVWSLVCLEKSEWGLVLFPGFMLPSMILRSMQTYANLKMDDLFANLCFWSMYLEEEFRFQGQMSRLPPNTAAAGLELGGSRRIRPGWLMWLIFMLFISLRQSRRLFMFIGRGACACALGVGGGVFRRSKNPAHRHISSAQTIQANQAGLH